uniref:C2H2-type domain-containing protein n=1 Tax=Anopheles culicifacies TaxID=139723 RepID=A0A182LVK3_9DIPT
MDLQETFNIDSAQNTIDKQMLASSLVPQQNVNNDKSDQSDQPENPPRCTIQCTECGKWFLDRYFLRRHELVHTKEKPYQCDKCSKSFTQKASLSTHMLIHSREKKYQCKLCPLKFVQKWNLETHVKQRHPNLDDAVLENRFLCQKCPSVFKTIGGLRAHRARIHGEMVMFDQCVKPTMATKNNEQSSNAAASNENNKDASDTASLDEDSSASKKAQQVEHVGEIVHKIIKSRRTEHMNGRTDKRQYVCEVCKAAFSKSAYLSQHMISHVGIRPHRCHICNKTYSSKQYYNTHMKLHSNTVRLFNCDSCEVAFNRYATVKRHQTMIHSVQQYCFRCPYCEKRFRWLHNARTHIKTFHSKEESAEQGFLEPIKESATNGQ